ncbi:hypothetical protein F0562_017010 [Nyssa sinensis]|uniref:LNS2/PITP domain-containing protein n=1 Tax=Nyssa sinensis TaxID=561372 RepID=A0A5J4ZF70_9ASTE|nr:hypothetical protein F0562_017010 [Nyssa sinensis]
MLKSVGNADQQETDSPLEIHEEAEGSQEKSPHSLPAVDETDEGIVGQLRNTDGLSPSNSACLFIHITPVDKGTESSLREPAPEDECSKSETVEPQATYSEGVKTDSSTSLSSLFVGTYFVLVWLWVLLLKHLMHTAYISEEEFRLSASSIIKTENSVIRFQESYLPWEKAAPVVLGMAVYRLHLPVEPKDPIPVEQDETSKAREDDSGFTTPISRHGWSLWPISFRRVKMLEHTSSNSSSEKVFIDSESEPTCRINSNIQRWQSVILVDARIYLWKWNARIVISDVDGTITKSGVLVFYSISNRMEKLYPLDLFLFILMVFFPHCTEMVLGTETLMNSVTGKLGSQRAESLSLTQRKISTHGITGKKAIARC